MSKIRYNVNICDSSPNKSELMIHFTKVCPNKCAFCIDKMNIGVKTKRPKLNAIINTIEKYKDYVQSVTISGGEPFVFIDDLLELINYIKTNTSLKVGIITSLPNICFEQKDKTWEIFEKCDTIQISLQHWNNDLADIIRGTKSKYSTFDRNIMYKELNLSFGDKIIGSVNILKPYFTDKESILTAINTFNKLGFNTIKICEMFDADDLYVDIPKTLGIKMNSPFAWGCKTEYDITKLLPDFNGKLYIKRSCFYRTKHQKASIWDLIKISTRWIFAKKYFFGVIHEDGKIAPYWL